MSGPITWRTVNGPSLSEASRPLLAAQQSFNGSFDVLNNVLRQRQEAATYAQTKQEEAAKQGYLNDLFAVDNVDALAQQRQVFQERLKGLTPEQQAAVRGQFDQRIAALRDQTRQAGEFEDFSRDRAERGEVDAVQGLISAGDFAGAKQRLEALNLRSEAPLYKALTEGERGQTKFGWDEAEAKHKEALRPLALDAEKLRQDASRANMEVARLQADSLADQRKQAIAEKAQKARQGALDAYVQTTAWDGGGLNTQEGMSKFTEGLKQLGVSEDQHADILYNLSKQFPNGMHTTGKDENGLPIVMPVPVSVALQAVAGSGEQWGAGLIPWWSRRGDDMAEELKTRLSDGRIKDTYQSISKARKGILDGSGMWEGIDPEATAPEQAGAALLVRLQQETQRLEAERKAIEEQEKKAAPANATRMPSRPLNLNWNELNGRPR